MKLKRFWLLLAVMIISAAAVAQKIGGKYAFTGSVVDGEHKNYNILGLAPQKLSIILMELPGAAPCLIMTGTSEMYGVVNTFSMPTSRSSYTYSGTQNGWYVFQWGLEDVYISADNSIVRIAPNRNKYSYSEFKRIN